MLPKTHLTSHSRMSGSRWVITTSWLSESLRPFLYSSSVYSYHQFLISSASVRSIAFLSLRAHFCMKCPLGISNFLKRSLVFPAYCVPLFLFIVYWRRVCFLSLLFFGILHSDGFIFSFLLCLSLLFFSQLFARPPQQPFCLFAFLFLGAGFGHYLLYCITNLHP